MTQQELTAICKKCKINDPDECVECEYMKRVELIHPTCVCPCKRKDYKNENEET